MTSRVHLTTQKIRTDSGLLDGPVGGVMSPRVPEAGRTLVHGPRKHRSPLIIKKNLFCQTYTVYTRVLLVFFMCKTMVLLHKF